VLGFLFSIAEPQNREVLGTGTVQNIWRAVLDTLISNLRLVECEEKHLDKAINDYCIVGACFASTAMIELLRYCISLNLEDQPLQLLNKLKLLAATEDPTIAFKLFLLGFAKNLSDLPTSDTPLGQQIHDLTPVFLEYILDTYARRCVGPAPLPPADFRRPKCGCGCPSCILLDEFLGGPTQEESKIVLETQELASHIKGQLPRLDAKIEEYETEIKELEIEEAKGKGQTEASGNGKVWEVRVKKTTLAWKLEKDKWEALRRSAVNIFCYAFKDEKDEDIRQCLDKRFKRLSEGVIEGSEA
jgi:DNA-binding protein YbaB